MVDGILSENFCVVCAGGHSLLQNTLANFSGNHAQNSFCKCDADILPHLAEKGNGQIVADASILC
jgi:hypothetical protein